MADNNQQIIRITKDYNVGLSAFEAEQRVKEGLVNAAKVKTNKTYGGIIFKNVFTYMNLICFLIAAAVIAVGAYSDALFVTIFAANIIIGTVQEIRAKRTIDKLSLVVSPKATTVRDGCEVELSADKLVLDDIVRYSAGNQICADSILIFGALEVNESMLTGESRPVKKDIGSLLFAGSFVSSGSGYSRVEHVGRDNYIEGLSYKAKQFKAPKSELVISLNKIVKILCILLVVLGVPLAISNYYAEGGVIAKTVTSTAGSLVGMIPAGMFLLTSVALAVGIVKLARKRTLVKDLFGIEMLARSNVLCLDKTGTITDGTMEVVDVVELKEGFNIDRLLFSVLSATDSQNSTAQAILNYCQSDGALEAKNIIPFSSERKKCAAEFKDGAFVLGAAEFVLPTVSADLKGIIDRYLNNGLRVLVLAKGDSIENDEITGDIEPISVIALADHIREDAQATIDWFKKNDVEIKIISGDDPVSVAYIAGCVGVAGADKYLNLDGLTEEEVRAAAEHYTVFGRVTPEQKFYIINQLKKNGKTVAMTGDGVNDILAFREADCSIAMAEGSEAARNVATLVLLNSRFSTMPDVVEEGRRVINNIQKSSSLFLMKNIFTMIFTLIILCMGVAYPITPSKLLLFEFAVIGIPSFLLALQPNKSLIKGRFIVTVLSSAVPYALVFVINAVLVYILTPFTNAAVDDMIVYTMNYIGFVALVYLSVPLNLYRFLLCLGSLLTITLGTIILPHIYLGANPVLNIAVINGTGIILLLALVALAAILLFALIKLAEFIKRKTKLS